MTSKSNINRKLIRYQNNPIDTQRTPENMYFWGILWADGYLKSPNRIELSLVYDDFCDIRHVVPNYFNFYERQREGRKKQLSAIACRSDLINFLFERGYDNKQIPSTFFTNHKFSNYWFLGVIDGDGCWYWNEKNRCKQFSLASCYDQNWDYFHNLLYSIGSSGRTKLTIQGKNKSSVVRMASKNNIKKLVNYLYPDGYEIGLYRKYYKASTMIS